jgi:hypothetical protein
MAASWCLADTANILDTMEPIGTNIFTTLIQANQALSEKMLLDRAISFYQHQTSLNPLRCCESSLSQRL